MSEWAMKRFWTEVSVQPETGGVAVRLDGRPVRTPAKALLLAPNQAVAEKIAQEWDAQEKTVDPNTMPWTRTTNAAIDKVAVQRPEVTEHLASYAGTDLLCYRADGPASLVARQCETWDPIIERLQSEFGVKLNVTQGVMPVEQNCDDLSRLTSAMGDMTDFQLAGFHDLVTLSGSFALGLAVTRNWATPDQLWAASRLDESWQIEQWGEDEEASEAAQIKKVAFLHATEVYHLGGHSDQISV